MGGHRAITHIIQICQRDTKEGCDDLRRHVVPLSGTRIESGFQSQSPFDSGVGRLRNSLRKLVLGPLQGPMVECEVLGQDSAEVDVDASSYGGVLVGQVLVDRPAKPAAEAG